MPWWSKQFWPPITLKNGRELVTLDDARALMLTFQRGDEGRPHLRYAVELLIRAADRGDRQSIDDAAHQLRRALTVEGLI